MALRRVGIKKTNFATAFPLTLPFREGRSLLRGGFLLLEPFFHTASIKRAGHGLLLPNYLPKLYQEQR